MHKQSQLNSSHNNDTGSSESAHKSQWQQMMRQGQCAHQEGDYDRASLCFADAIKLAEQLEQQQLVARGPHSGCLPMQFAASHNLSACFSAQGIASKALGVLRDMHRKLLVICDSAQTSREVRVEALGILDNSLFSLSSQLGALGQLDEVYRVIRETESIASRAEQTLWH